MTNEEKAEEIALKYAREYLVSRNDSHKQNILFKESSIIECEKASLEMANWKDEQFEDCFYSVLSIKMLYFLNEKEKRENTTIDKMDWHKTIDEFAHYLKQQEN